MHAAPRTSAKENSSNRGALDASQARKFVLMYCFAGSIGCLVSVTA
jgi:hypothetical protein